LQRPAGYWPEAAAWIGTGAKVRRHPQNVQPGQPGEYVDPRGIDRLSQRPVMAVFNNLVLYDQNVKQNALEAIVPDLATSWSPNRAACNKTFGSGSYN
jgi:ABC-type transport system substrate-binding protein